MEKLIYSNKLRCDDDINDFVLEGYAHRSFENGRLRLENVLSKEEYDQKANYVLWCPVEFNDGIRIEWDFYPICEPTLCMMMFAAKGKDGESIFADGLKKRTGEYDCYLHGDINLYHLSYFRRNFPTERAFHTCQLRKSNGGHRLSAGGDPIPSVEDAISPYHLSISIKNGHIVFFINDLKVIDYIDDGKEYGEVLKGGKIGFRQMAPGVCEYSNLSVYEI